MLPCRPLHRLFYGLRPRSGAALAIDRDTAWLGRQRRVRPDMLHVTLNILDDWPVQPKHLIEAMMRVGDQIAAKPFRVVFDQLSGSARSVVLRPSERIGALYDFQQLLAARLARAGIETRMGVRFSPHISILHRGRSNFVVPAVPVSWLVEEFLLIESLVGWTEHRVQGRWPLIPIVTSAEAGIQVPFEGLDTGLRRYDDRLVDLRDFEAAGRERLREITG